MPLAAIARLLQDSSFTVQQLCKSSCKAFAVILIPPVTASEFYDYVESGQPDASFLRHFFEDYGTIRHEINSLTSTRLYLAVDKRTLTANRIDKLTRILKRDCGVATVVSPIWIFEQMIPESIMPFFQRITLNQSELHDLHKHANAFDVVQWKNVSNEDIVKFDLTGLSDSAYHSGVLIALNLVRGSLERAGSLALYKAMRTYAVKKIQGEGLLSNQQLCCHLFRKGTIQWKATHKRNWMSVAKRKKLTRETAKSATCYDQKYIDMGTSVFKEIAHSLLPLFRTDYIKDSLVQEGVLVKNADSGYQVSIHLKGEHEAWIYRIRRSFLEPEEF